MAAMTKGRRVIERDGESVSHPLAAGAKIYGGALAVLDGGYLKPGRTAVGLKAVGVSTDDADNSGGAAGAISVTVCRRPAFQFANFAADLVGRPHIGGTAYVIDDQTVAATDGAGTRSAAGRIIDVDAAGVWIEFV